MPQAIFPSLKRTPLPRETALPLGDSGHTTVHPSPLQPGLVNHLHSFTPPFLNLAWALILVTLAGWSARRRAGKPGSGTSITQHNAAAQHQASYLITYHC